MKSFTLIEVIFAIFIITIGSIGAFYTIQKAIDFNSLILSRFTAAYLAQEGAEIVRNIKDSNWLKIHHGVEGQDFWDNGLTSCENGCEADYNDTELTTYQDKYLKFENSTGFYGYATGTDTKFKRKISITKNGDILKVSVDVFWEQRGKLYCFTVKENLYKR